MKKQLLIITLLCFSLFLFGCNGTTEETGSTETAQQETTETETAEVNTTEINTTETETTGKAPSDEEMKAIFDEAYEVYQWFELEKLEVETDGNSVVMYEIGDNLCGKVTDNRVSSFEELSDIAHSYFSDDICHTLLTDGLYFEEDGVLYQILADRGGDITRGEILSEGVTERTDDAITYTVTVETYDPATDSVTGSEDIHFIYENIGDQWVFSQFQSIY